MSEIFFMVYLENQNTPAYKHTDIKSAETEAKRLAKLHQKRAYILVTLKSYELMEFIEKDFRGDIPDLPF